MKLSRISKNDIQLSAARVILFGFALIILFGAVLLSLPVASADGTSLNFLDALFTSTSSVCVTGLIVVDTPTQFSVFGELVIMVLIQLGGLGFMTFGVLLYIILGKKISFKERMIIQQSTNAMNPSGVVKLSLRIFLIALIVESAAALILTVRPLGRRLRLVDRSLLWRVSFDFIIQ
ncbi:potassium transporter TrkG [Marinicrinis lubricantis]|uniref:Potassium transporter TrkG n=1 Tax=Marinicrinis lubricantis TaxID=2086470 RepID=A0ABW1ITX6_9BACL